MFLLLLMGLGAASVKAQVRIGGNGAPNAAAVLDLNATDATTNGTKGLALPRVDLTSPIMQLTTGVANLTGMMVYNTTATLGDIGIYYWNGTTWVLAGLPSTSPADSGYVLKSNGKTWYAVLPYVEHKTVDSLTVLPTASPITWSLVLNTVWHTSTQTETGDYVMINATGIKNYDLCYAAIGQGVVYTSGNGFVMCYILTRSFAQTPLQIKCYRPSA